MRWLNLGGFSLCSFLAEMVGGRDKGPALFLQPQDLPPNAVDQVFLTRKCIGFPWLHEIAAASVLLCIVEHGTPDAVPSSAIAAVICCFDDFVALSPLQVFW